MVNNLYDEEESSFLNGEEPSIADLLLVLSFTFIQLINGSHLSTYPRLLQAQRAIEKKYQKHWKTVNFEYDGCAQYLSTLNNRDESPSLEHSVIFNDSVHTVFERILDPNNEIFLFLASKTISTKTNAKLKKGLKTLGEEGIGSSSSSGGINSSSISGSAGALSSSEKEPYIISLEMGGSFNINNREGTNLLLIPGSKIVQVSHMKDWTPGHHSMEIYELTKIDDATSLLRFKQLNIPPTSNSTVEEFWNRFWKKLNGLRIDALEQTVYFRQKAPMEVYNLIADNKQLSKVLKQKIKEENGYFSLHNKLVLARNKELVLGKRIIQDWRCSDWPDDHWAECTLEVESLDGGAHVKLALTAVPYDKVKQVGKVWTKNMWLKIGGTVVGEIRQEVSIRDQVSGFYLSWLSSDDLTSRLKTKVQASPTVSGPMQIGPWKGINLELQPNKKIIQRFVHKDWPNQHPSLVTLDFAVSDHGGSKIILTHSNIPVKSLSWVEEWWKTDVWEKAEAILLSKRSITVFIEASPKTVFSTLLDSSKMSKITGKDATVGIDINCDISFFDKTTKGKITQIIPEAVLKCSFRDYDWPFGHYGELSWHLSESQTGSKTFLTLCLNNVPVNSLPDMIARWEHVLKQLQSTLNQT